MHFRVSAECSAFAFAFPFNLSAHRRYFNFVRSLVRQTIKVIFSFSLLHYVLHETGETFEFVICISSANVYHLKFIISLIIYDACVPNQLLLHALRNFPFKCQRSLFPALLYAATFTFDWKMKIPFLQLSVSPQFDSLGLCLSCNCMAERFFFALS